MGAEPPVLNYAPGGGVSVGGGGNGSGGVPRAGNLYYWPSIDNLTGGVQATDLDAQDIADLPSESLIIVITGVDGDESHWRRMPDASSPVTDVDLGIIVPTNYDSGTRPWVLLQELTGGGGGAVDSVFGRAGAVTALVGDYSAFYSLLGHTHTFASITATPTTLVGYGITDAQPLDADLTSIAALTTTSFGRGFLTQADAASSRTYIGAGTGSGTSITATSPIVVTPTPLTATGVFSLDKTVDLAMTAAQTTTLTDAATSTISPVLTIGHNSSGTVAAAYGTGILFKGKSNATNDRIMGQFSAGWNNPADGSRNTFVQMEAAGTALSGAGLRVYSSQFVTNDLTADAGAAYINANSGFRVAGAAATSNRFLVGNSASFVSSTYALPSTPSTSGKVVMSDGTNLIMTTNAYPTTGLTTARKIVVSDGTNLVMSTETWAVPGAATNFLKSDGTNWTAAQPAFSNLSGNWTLAQGPSITAGKLLGRDVGSAGIPQEITLGTNLSMSGTTLNATGGGGGTPGGSTTQLQYNNAGAFGGITGGTWDGTTLTLPAPTNVSSNSAGRNELRLTNTHGTSKSSQLTFNSGATQLWYLGNDSTVSGVTDFYLYDSVGGAIRMGFGGIGGGVYQAVFSSGTTVGWTSSGTGGTSGIDTGLIRNAAGVVEVNNGTAGTYRDLKAQNVNVTSSVQVNGIATSADYPNSSVSSQLPSTADVYVAGSSVPVPAGGFKAKGQYRCTFDVAKSAGTGAIVITLRVGTTGTVASDAAIFTSTFGAGTSVSDGGMFEVIANWRTVGSGTSAVISGYCRGTHNLLTTGLFNNAQVWQPTASVSSGFDSSTATTIGVSFNGGTAFAGTITTVQATLFQV